MTEPRTHPCPKWIRGVKEGKVVVDSRNVQYVWTDRPYPAWGFPPADVGDVESQPFIDGLVYVKWTAVDHWLEEDEEVYVHPRDPFSRVDILPSSRRVRVEIDGVTVAESDQPRILYETGLPPRYYLPLTSIRQDLLRPSATQTGCPYKGFAAYWSVEVNGTLHEDIAWTYRTPLPESQKIAGLVAFYNERVDLVVE